MINFPLEWHPQFSRHTVKSIGCVFLAENQQFFIENSEFVDLETIINHGGSVSDFVFSETSADTASLIQINRLRRIDRLIEDGILIDPTAPSDCYFLPDFSEASVTETSVTETLEGINVYFLSARVTPSDTQAGAVIPALQQQLQAFNTLLPKDLTLVIVDDYMDARLPVLNRKFIQENTTWMPIKLTGRLPMAGPIFFPQQTHSPCVDCLQTRLLQNQPVREWLTRVTNVKAIRPLPIQYNCAALTQSIKHLSECIDSIVNTTDNYYLAELSKDKPLHRVDKLAKCKTCGNESLLGHSNNTCVKLEDQIKHNDCDGGYRTQSRAETLSTIQSLISPITGVISDLTELTAELTPDKGLKVFRAAYFQNTYQHSQPTEDTFVQLALGKGVSATQAQASALGEAIERLAAQYRGDEAIINAAPCDLPARAVTPQQLTPYSEAQYQVFKQCNGVSLTQPQWVQAYDRQTPLHWIAGWSLTHDQPLYFPAAYCLANTPFNDHVYSLYNHNGNAAGNTVEEAVLQGTLELIERDACAIWWYNRIPRPELAMSMIDPEQRSVIDRTLSKEWQYWLLDITNDIPICCCAAVAQHRQTGAFVLGFGCHLQPAIACQRALTELYQLIVVKDKVSGPFDFNAIKPQPYLYPKKDTPQKYSTDFPIIENNTIKNDILYIQEVLANRELELCVVNYSREDLPLKTVKVLVPGLCHFWPQFASHRLYHVPVRCHWLSHSLCEDELNPMALYL